APAQANATNTNAANRASANATNARPSAAATPARQEGAHASAPPPGATKNSPNRAAKAPAGSAQPAAGAKGSQTDAASGGASQPVEVGSLIARASQTVAPTYPAAARTARIGGRVTVYLLVDEKGEVAAVQRTEGPEMLRRAAEEAARRWKFRPAVINNQPARVTGYVSFNFAP
ncbi:MAG: energy transducer TonB, partial [Pyrinomonadaceae bacterium]